MVHEEAYQPAEVHRVHHLHSTMHQVGRESYRRHIIGDTDQRTAVRSNEGQFDKYRFRLMDEREKTRTMFHAPQNKRLQKKKALLFQSLSRRRSSHSFPLKILALSSFQLECRTVPDVLSF